MSRFLTLFVVLGIGCVGATADCYDVKVTVYDDLQQAEHLVGFLRENTATKSVHLTFYWHEPISRHEWENGPFGCSEWLLEDGVLHFWMRMERYAGPRRGSVVLNNVATAELKIPEREAASKGVDTSSVLFLLANEEANKDVSGTGIAGKLWKSGALQAFKQGAEYEGRIEPEETSFQIDSDTLNGPHVEKIDRFPPYGRTVRVSRGADGSISMVVRRTIDEAPLVEVIKSPVAEKESETPKAVYAEDLGKMLEAPESYRVYWALRDELDHLNVEGGDGSAYRAVFARAETALKDSITPSLRIAELQLGMYAASRAGNLEDTSVVLGKFISACKDTDYKRWAVYESGQALKFLLDAGLEVSALDTLSTETARAIVDGKYMGDDESTTILLQDLLATGWLFYAGKLLDALENSGSQSSVLKAVRSQIEAASTSREILERIP